MAHAKAPRRQEITLRLCVLRENFVLAVQESHWLAPNPDEPENGSRQGAKQSLCDSAALRENFVLAVQESHWLAPNPDEPENGSR